MLIYGSTKKTEVKVDRNDKSLDIISYRIDSVHVAFHGSVHCDPVDWQSEAKQYQHIPIEKVNKKFLDGVKDNLIRRLKEMNPEDFNDSLFSSVEDFETEISVAFVSFTGQTPAFHGRTETMQISI